MSKTHRIEFLDGFRGVAILLVILFHTYFRWPTHVPYGNEFSRFPLFSKGFIGVQLFFLISGFVILMTLEKSQTMRQFIYKRWLRLFPAMVICTLFVVLTLPFFPERPFGMPRLTAVIPGLLFIEPEWIRTATGVDVGILEASFWSLYVEVKFYVLFGLIYFYFSARAAIIGIFTLYCFWLVAHYALPPHNPLLVTAEALSFQHFGWFTCGALSYLYYIGKNKNLLLYTLLAGVISVGSLDITTKGTPIAATVILLVFVATIYFDQLKPIFENRVLLFIGFISYPLYLIHENTLIALIIKLGKQFMSIPHIVLPFLPILLLIGIAYVIAKYLEPLLRKLLTRKNKTATATVNHAV